jgi:AcrR family transcriptional regulator
MAQTDEKADSTPRVRLNRDRVLRAAVELADRDGLDAVSMRNLAEQLGVVPMALYKHVANKEELLDGMVDVIVGDFDEPTDDPDWKEAVREQVLAARRVLLQHPWARQVLESRTSPTPVVLGYMDSLIGRFRAGGFSNDLTHHVMHALGSRMWGFSPELFDDRQTVGPRTVDPEAQVAMMQSMAEQYPNIAELSLAAIDAAGPRASEGCDEQFELEFALDLLLDGFERLHQQGWTSAST